EVIWQVVVPNGVVHGGIPVYPDRVVVLPDGVQVGPVGPGAVHGLGVVQHLAHAEDTARVPTLAQALERAGELVGHTQRQVIDDQHVRLEHLHGAANDSGAERAELIIGGGQ